MDLKNRVIIVTASTRGIGKAAVELMAAMGGIVYLAARRMDYAQSLCDEYTAKGWNVKPVYFNAYETECYQAMADTVFQAEGRIDVLVNNFGTSDPRVDRDLENTAWDTFEKTVDVNLKSVFLTSQCVIPYMKKNGGGAIINISSIGGLVPDISQIGYGVSKAGINYLTKLIAVQEARSNITCNAVLPGMTATDAVKDNLTEGFQSMFMKHTPIQRMGEPEEVAAAIAYFASKEASYVTGQIMEVSGGFGMPTPIYGDLISGMQKR